MSRTIIDGVTRLAQMKEHTRTQLAALNEEWNRLYNLAVAELDQMGAGIDDIAMTLGIIEPPMPMMPPRIPTGPQPTLGGEAVTFDTDLDRYQP